MAIVQHVRTRSPFYRELWQGRDAADWRTFPTVDKRVMMAEFDRFTTIGVTREVAMRVALDAEARRISVPWSMDRQSASRAGPQGIGGCFWSARVNRRGGPVPSSREPFPTSGLVTVLRSSCGPTAASTSARHRSCSSASSI